MRIGLCLAEVLNTLWDGAAILAGIIAGVILIWSIVKAMRSKPPSV